MNIDDAKNSENTPKTVVKFIEEYESIHPEEIWKKEAQKIYSTGAETLYQFRGNYYKGIRQFISRKTHSGREYGSYGEETRTEITEKEAQVFIKEYENAHPEEIWKKEAEKIYSTGAETLYQFRGNYYKGIRQFISRKTHSGREYGNYGEETRTEITEKEAQAFIEEYENTHPEEIWKNEAEKIYSTGAETLYQFRGNYYKGIRQFISRKTHSGREYGNYGEETRTEITEKEAQAFIEEYENTHPEEIWNKEAEKIYSTGGETLYQFRGNYYRGTRPFISRINNSGRECGKYGEETRKEITEKDAQTFIEEYENTHPEEIWKKEAEKIYSTGGETLYQFRGNYYRGIRPFISRITNSGIECGNYGEETLQLMKDREENNITLSNIKKAIEYSKELTI